MNGITGRALLSITSIGYLVPRRRFDGEVHSVYSRACNISCRDGLLTLLTPGSSEGPTVLLLGAGSPLDLRSCFRAGDAVTRRGTRLRSKAMVADVGHATVWEAARAPTVAEAAQVAANLCVARVSIAAWVQGRTSVLHREALETCGSVELACRACDIDDALPHAGRLIGWGEGLTPAGDDFLVGLMSGLHALTLGSAARLSFLRCLGAAMSEGAARTTPVAAHHLRLAARGHFTATIHQLRAALLSEDTAALQRSMDDAFRLGATSGADLATGLVSGIAAWYQSPSQVQP